MNVNVDGMEGYQTWLRIDDDQMVYHSNVVFWVSCFYTTVLSVCTTVLKFLRWLFDEVK